MALLSVLLGIGVALLIASGPEGGRGAGTLMIKANDLALLPAGTGPWSIVGCGITARDGWSLPPREGARATGRCGVGQDRIFASLKGFSDAVGQRRVDAGDVIIFDPEAWFYTPRHEFNHQVKYLVLVGRLARRNGIQIIYTPPWTTSRSLLDAEYRAAAHYASAIELQTQYLQWQPTLFRSEVMSDLAVIRAISPRVPVLVGFATDPGGRPAVLREMLASYRGVSTLVQGFQLNLPLWRPPRGLGCALSGCVDVGVSFLRAVGAR